MRQSARLYGWLGIAYFVLIIPAGILFFWSGTRAEPIPRAEWLLPCISLVTVTSAAIALMPFLALIEGGSKVTEVAMLRLSQGMVGSLACWWMLWQGAGLWAVVMILGACLIVPLAFNSASHHGAAGVISVILLVQVLFVLPASVAVWWRCQPVLRRAG